MEKAKILGRLPRKNGRTQVKIRCICGGIFHASLWAWAGNGRVKCPGCRVRIRYGSMEIINGEDHG